MRARIEERAQPFGRAGDRIRPRDADGVKPLSAGESLERRLERGRT
jgi:hypothetical protein